VVTAFAVAVACSSDRAEPDPAAVDAAADAADDVTTDAAVEDGGRDAGEEPVPCDRILNLGGSWTGLEACAGRVHRIEAVECAPNRDYPACTDNLPSSYTCLYDSDCTDQSGGYCYGSGYSCDCIYTCTTDDDCGPGQACVCDSTNTNYIGLFTILNRCVPAGCRTDADCGGTTCGLSIDVCKDVRNLACHGPDDTCSSDLDCGPESTCTFHEEVGAWTCDEPATCG